MKQPPVGLHPAEDEGLDLLDPPQGAVVAWVTSQ